jgi:hypothetical protein
VPKRDLYSRSVFINCPFSADYQPIFRAILFSVYYCGYGPRCALEVSDSTQNRLSKIEGIIQGCRFGIHDISFVNVDPKTKVPRFNMPFELGMFFAAKRFGSYKQKQKVALVLDTHAYRYRKSLSDISGQDIEVHNGRPKTAIRQIRDWLNACHRGSDLIPGGDFIAKQYNKYSRQLPNALKKKNLSAHELTYADICTAMESWLKDNA